MFEQFTWRKLRRAGTIRFESAEMRALAARAQHVAVKFGDSIVRPTHVLTATLPPNDDRLVRLFLLHGIHLGRLIESFGSGVAEDGESRSLRQSPRRDASFSNWSVLLIRRAAAQRHRGTREPIDLIDVLTGLLQLGYEPMRSIVIHAGISESVLRSIALDAESDGRTP